MTDETTTVTEEVEEAPAAPEPDPQREELVERLRAVIGDALVEHRVERNDVWVRVDAASWRTTVEAIKNRLGFEMFVFLSGIDWLRNPELVTRYERAWPEPGEERAPGEPLPEWSDVEGGGSGAWKTGLAGGDTRFQVFARFFDIDRKLGITVKADLDSDHPSVESIHDVYRGADWHEREAWEMFGFDFPGHPGLRHMYLPGEFEGYPLRKDFPLLSRAVKPWPGLVDKEPVPGEGEEEEGDS